MALKALLCVLSVVTVELSAAAQAPFIQDSRVVTDDGGRATSVEAKIVGGTGPYSGTLFVALPGQGFESVALTQSPLPDVVVGTLPAQYQSRPFGYYLAVKDSTGTAAEKGSASSPLFFAPDEPPAPEAPPDSLPPSMEAAPSETPPAAAAPAEAPHPTTNKASRARAKPARDDEDIGPTRTKRRRTERVVACCGVPIWGTGAQPVFLIGAAVAGLAAISMGAVAILFLLDLSQAQRMTAYVDRARRRNDPAPSECGNWGDCGAKYERAFWVDTVAVVGSLLLGLGLGATSVALLLTAGAFRRE